MYILKSTLLGLLVTTASCNAHDFSIPGTADDPMSVYWEVQLNHHAATLSMYAPWNTMQLSLIPLTLKGDTMSLSNGTQTFESSDSNSVSVTSTGLVRAKVVTTSVQIYASLTLGKLTYRDTLYVKVVSDPSPKTLQLFSIQPKPGDSAKVSMSTFPYSIQQHLKRTASTGQEMSELLIYYRSLNPAVASIDRRTGGLSVLGAGKRLGPVVFVASTYAYGVARADTLELIMGYPLKSRTSFIERPLVDKLRVETVVDVSPVRVGVGADITFGNTTQNDIDLVFDDTTNIRVRSPRQPNESVNVNIAYGYVSVRRFVAPGEYTYRDTKSGAIGKILVIDER